MSSTIHLLCPHGFLSQFARFISPALCVSARELSASIKDSNAIVNLTFHMEVERERGRERAKGSENTAIDLNIVTY